MSKQVIGLKQIPFMAPKTPVYILNLICDYFATKHSGCINKVAVSQICWSLN